MTNKHIIIAIVFVCGLLLSVAVAVAVRSSKDTVALKTPPAEQTTDELESVTDREAVAEETPSLSPTPVERPTTRPTRNSPSKAPPSMGPYQVLIEDPGTTGGLVERKTVVIFDRTGLRDLWTEMYAGVDPPPELPTVDFAKYAVVGGFMGEQPSGGYSIVLQGVEDLTDKTLVTFEEISPGEGCIATQAITKPFVLVAVQNTGKQFNTDVLRTTKDCQ